jgi:hypothetical protein
MTNEEDPTATTVVGSAKGEFTLGPLSDADQDEKEDS